MLSSHSDRQGLSARQTGLSGRNRAVSASTSPLTWLDPFRTALVGPRRVVQDAAHPPVCQGEETPKSVPELHGRRRGGA